VVSIRPGVVHRWNDIADLVGAVILFVPTAPTPPCERARRRSGHGLMLERAGCDMAFDYHRGPASRV